MDEKAANTARNMVKAMGRTRAKNQVRDELHHAPDEKKEYLEAVLKSIGAMPSKHEWYCTYYLTTICSCKEDK